MDARRIALNLIKEHGDIYEAYAAVNNSTALTCLNEQDREVKQQLEYMLAIEAMEAQNWDRDEYGRWHKEQEV